MTWIHAQCNSTVKLFIPDGSLYDDHAINPFMTCPVNEGV